VLGLNDQLAASKKIVENHEARLKEMDTVKAQVHKQDNDLGEKENANRLLQQEKEILEGQMRNLKGELGKECEKNGQLQNTIQELLQNIQNTNNELQASERSAGEVKEKLSATELKLDELKHKLDDIDLVHSKEKDVLDVQITTQEKKIEALRSKLAKSNQTLMMSKFFLAGLSAPPQVIIPEEEHKEVEMVQAHVADQKKKEGLEPLEQPKQQRQQH